jgi:hypothetical protein
MALACIVAQHWGYYCLKKLGANNVNKKIGEIELHPHLQLSKHHLPYNVNLQSLGGYAFVQIQ